MRLDRIRQLFGLAPRRSTLWLLVLETLEIGHRPSEEDR